MCKHVCIIYWSRGYFAIYDTIARKSYLVAFKICFQLVKMIT